MAMSRYIKVKEKTENKWLIPLFVFLFAALGVAFAAGGYTYGRYVTIIILGLATLLNIDDLFCLICFALPFASMLKLAQGSTTILAILYIIILIKLMSREKMDLPPISFFAFLVFAALQTLTIFFYDSVITNIFSTLLNIAFVFLISNYFLSKEFNNPNLLTNASLCFSLSTTLDLLLCDIFPNIPRLVHAKRYAVISSANRYAASVLDPNELSQIILIAISLLIAIFPSFKNKTSKFFAIAMIIYMAITGVRTNSKSYVLTIIPLFLFLIFIYLRTIFKNKGATATIMHLIPILLLTIAGGLLIINYMVIPVFEARSGENTDLLTNRSSIWSRYIMSLFSNPDVLFIGCGANNVTSLLRLAGLSGDGVPHNAYLEYIIQFGLGGLTMMYLCWKKAFISIKNKLNTFFVLPLISFLITSFGLSINANDCFFILFTLLALPLAENINTPLISFHKDDLNNQQNQTLTSK